MMDRTPQSPQLPEELHAAITAVHEYKTGQHANDKAFQRVSDTSRAAIRAFEQRLADLQAMFRSYGGSPAEARSAASASQIQEVLEVATDAMRRILAERSVFLISARGATPTAALLSALENGLRPYTEVELALTFLRQRKETLDVANKAARRRRLGMYGASVLVGLALLFGLVWSNEAAHNRERVRQVGPVVYMMKQSNQRIDSSLLDTARLRQYGRRPVTITLTEAQALLLNAHTALSQLPVNTIWFGHDTVFHESVERLRVAQGLASSVIAAERQLTHLTLQNDGTAKWDTAAAAYLDLLRAQHDAVSAVLENGVLNQKVSEIPKHSMWDDAFAGRNRLDVLIRVAYALAYVMIAGGIIMLAVEFSGDALREAFTNVSRLQPLESKLSFSWQAFAPLAFGAGLVGAAATTTPPPPPGQPPVTINNDALNSRVDSLIRLLQPVPQSLADLRLNSDSTLSLANAVQSEVNARIQ